MSKPSQKSIFFASKFVESSLEHHKKNGAWPICIGPDCESKILTNVDKWLNKRYLKNINRDCPFKIEGHSLNMIINVDFRLTIEAMVFGSIDKEYECKIDVSKSEFIKEMAVMLTFYANQKWYICINGEDVICGINEINNIFDEK